jgi:hypothetical protein
MILKWILKAFVVMVWTGFILHVVEISGGPLCTSK